MAAGHQQTLLTIGLVIVYSNITTLSRWYPWRGKCERGPVARNRGLTEHLNLSHCPNSSLLLLVATGVVLTATASWGQFADGPQNLRPATTSVPSTDGSVMVPLNSTRNYGFDPYAARSSTLGGYGSVSGALMPQSTATPSYSALQPPSVPFSSSAMGGAQNFGGNTFNGNPIGGPVFANGNPYGGYQGAPLGGPVGGMMPGNPYPSYNGPAPILPGAGQSAIVQTNPPLFGNNLSTPGALPNSTPSALFPGPYGNNSTGGWFGNLFGGGANSSFGGGGYGPGAATPYPTTQYNQWPGNGGYGGGTGGGMGNWSWNNGFNWNPQGSVFNGQYNRSPTFIQLLQHPRFRHTYIHRGDKYNDLGINDSDVAISLVIPNFGISNQPIYISPSFSFHQWDGPLTDPPRSTADLPAQAYSAFLDAAWQSDPTLILGAELGARVGVFTDFETLTTRSLRIMGRGIGRIRLTPAATLKLGVLYLDRNRVKLLPAGGILWQPNPATRLDLFFPEPKLSAYLTTLGNIDTWWYVAGYYGGGAWTIQRADNSKDSIDINDIRVVLGLEWGRNEMMRDGRRVGFAEIGYVFDRELLYRANPGDNLRLNESFVVRAGFGY